MFHPERDHDLVRPRPIHHYLEMERKKEGVEGCSKLQQPQTEEREERLLTFNSACHVLKVLDLCRGIGYENTKP